MSRTRSIAFTLSLLFGITCVVQAVPIYDFAPVASEMQQFVQSRQLAGASLRVSKSGNVVYRQAFGSYSTDTRIHIASASKWLSALTIARLVDKGQMHWTDSVGQYIPSAPADKQAITLEQLFSHTSALPGDEDGCLSSPLYTLTTCAQKILQSPLLGTPGTVFAYGGNSMQVAGRMAELATGKAWDDIFLDEMVRPLGLVATDYATSSTAPGYVRSSNPRIAGGIRSTIDDYGRAVDMVLARGCLVGFFPQCPDSQRFLGAATLDTMARDRTVTTTDISRPPTSTGFGYGLGQWIDVAQAAPGQIPIVSSPGAFGFTPWVDRVRGIAGVFLVDDLNTRVVNDINDIRAMVNVVTADGAGRRIKPVQPPELRASLIVKAPDSAMTSAKPVPAAQRSRSGRPYR